MSRTTGFKSDSRPDWFLAEWMATLQVSQAELARRCDWSKSTMHDIYHGKTHYYREVINTIASAMHLQPYELLMPPQLANELKVMNNAVLRAAEERLHYVSEPQDLRQSNG